ncbi:MAG: hypothetical protein COV45_07765 [Deltaproteobacteria bacterium CG11_big_fil_rev_8_21_14_0_20_47_16]|nr:MAG: hypothetical protein COV45_07765 [Deltaproteobacteria bacterium CG11_big_fil_rev_8_21_14_0_20_47_16]
MKLPISIIGIVGILLGSPVWAATDSVAVPDKAPVETCQAKPLLHIKRCELDLCLDESPSGVVAGHTVITGTIKGGAAAGILAYVQNDRSKSVTHINTQKSLLADGTFEIAVPLPQLGSYTVVIQAMRLVGGPQMISARVARIQKPHDMTASAVNISQASPDADHVEVTVDLEKSCRDQAKSGAVQNCDLIGSETGATTIEVENKVSSGATVVRRSNVGAEGVYSLCMPLGNGSNVLTVKVSSAAVEPSQVLHTQTVAYNKLDPTVEWIDTTPGKLRFKIANWKPNTVSPTCDGEVELEWNREVVVNPETGEKTRVQKICPKNGEYSVDKSPAVGINEMGIRLPGDKTGREFRYTFGWGRAVWAKDWIPSAIAMRVDGDVLNRELPNMVNAFLTSDNFAAFVSSLLGPPKPATPDSSESDMVTLQRQVRGDIPGCTVGQKSQTTLSVTENPEIANAYVNDVKLEDNRLSMDVTLEGVTIKANYYKDADNFIPLKIGFKSLRIQPQFVVVNKGEKSLALLTAPEDDCQFKDESYCKHQPAIFQPKDFRGNIDGAGAFVMCDGSSNLLSEKIKDLCKSVNNVDAKYGIISSKILDALNEALYCDGSALLTTQLFRSFMPMTKDFNFLGHPYTWSMKNQVNADSLRISPDGIQVSLSSQVDGGGFYYSAAQAGANLLAPKQQSFGMNIREDLINQALAALTTMGQPGEGLLDIDLDESTFALLGFDFTTECAKIPTPTLCNLRPIVQKFFGTDLPMYAGDQPLRLRIRANRTLAPRLSVRRDEAGTSIVDFDLPNLEIQFLALPENPTDEPTSIITARFTVLLSLTVDAVQTNPKDPSQLSIVTHLRMPESHVTIMPVDGSNTTLVPDHVLVGKLRTLISWGLSEFGKEGSSLPAITIPKSFALPNGALTGSSTSLLARFGLSEIELGDGHLKLAADPFGHSISIAATPIILQTLTQQGVTTTHRWGE